MAVDFIRFPAEGAEFVSHRPHGHDFGALIDAFDEAARTKGKPSFILADTVKGKGVSFMENKRDWHGKAPNAEQYEQAVRELRGGRA